MELIQNKYWAENVFNNCEVDVIYKGCQDKEQPYDDYSIHHKVAFCLSTPFPGPFTSTPDSQQSLLCCSPRNEVVCLCQILNEMQCLQVYQARFPSLPFFFEVKCDDGMETGALNFLLILLSPFCRILHYKRKCSSDKVSTKNLRPIFKLINFYIDLDQFWPIETNFRPFYACKQFATPKMRGILRVDDDWLNE